MTAEETSINAKFPIAPKSLPETLVILGDFSYPPGDFNYPCQEFSAEPVRFERVQVAVRF